MYSAIDALRNANAPSKHSSLAEKIAVAMHRLEAARRRGDEEATDEVKNQLDGLVGDWFDTRIPGPPAPPRPQEEDDDEETDEEQEEQQRPVPTISQAGRFVQFRRGDGSLVACQISRVLYVSKGDHGAVLQFGNGTQLNLRNTFEEVLYLLEVE